MRAVWDCSALPACRCSWWNIDRDVFRDLENRDPRFARSMFNGAAAVRCGFRAGHIAAWLKLPCA
jgi:hypothetical protein